MNKLIKISFASLILFFTVNCFAIGAFRCAYRMVDEAKLAEFLDKPLCEEILNTCSAPGFQKVTGDDQISVSLEVNFSAGWGQATTFALGDKFNEALANGSQVKFTKDTFSKFNFPNHATKFPNEFLGVMCDSVKKFSRDVVANTSINKS